MTDAVSRLAAIQARIAGRAALVAVSKTFSAGEIEPVLQAGQRLFGENRVQEAAAKWPGLRVKFGGVELHLIGPLQSNKAAEAVALFDVIQTIDRPKIAEAVAKEMKKAGKRLRCLIQVNTGHEPQKAGIAPEALDGFLRQCREDYALPVSGLMCIPPVEGDPRPHFKALAEMAKRHGLKELSMGMSGDFETAIEEGATLVRVGSAIFGSRPQITR
ncbi:MAG: YggS family pyridoxal phosphate-dependent enzyme [Alphaproteobacteria bacterium]|nr:YggS family pyridoxal phosphate-dependent enzyme [Alphaproteobacteria bacterium]